MAVRTMRSRFPGKCSACGGQFNKGETINYDDVARSASHTGCEVQHRLYEEPAGNPNNEQASILEFASSELGNKNLMIEALAGTGKTWLLQKIVYRIAANFCGWRGKYITFSKKLAEEAQEKFDPELCQASTFHSLGYQLWKSEYRGAKIDNNKMRDILENFDWGVPTEDGRVIDRKHEVLESLNWARETMVSPQKAAYQCGFTDWPEHFWQQCYDALNECRRMSYKLDFVDMIWLPVQRKLKMPRVDYLMIDEFQDLNGVMLAFLTECVHPSTRFIVVGDRNQMIFEWRGAKSSGMDDFRRDFSCALMEQPETFRCPRNHVELVKLLGLVPQYRGEKAPAPLWQGLMKDAEKWINSTHTVMARTNATLAAMAMKLLREGKNAVLKDKRFGDQLLSRIKKTKVLESAPTLDCLRVLRRETDVEIMKLQDKLGDDDNKKDTLESLISQKTDLLECFEAIAEGVGVNEPLHVFIAKLEEIFNDDQPGVHLYTIHGSKGKTFDKSVILDFETLWEKGYKKKTEAGRLLYVALTRSENELIMLSRSTKVVLPVPEFMAPAAAEPELILED